MKKQNKNLKLKLDLLNISNVKFFVTDLLLCDCGLLTNLQKVQFYTEWNENVRK